MSVLDDMESSELLVYASEVRKQYNDIRRRFFNDSRHYYNQSIAASYYKEEDLIDTLEECRRVKAHYMDICDILKARGIKSEFGMRRTNNDSVFKNVAESKDILHLA